MLSRKLFRVQARPTGMRRLVLVLLVSATALAQRPPRRAPVPQGALTAEMAVKQATEKLGNDRKAIELQLKVLAHIRASDRALTDPMQPTIAVEKAFEQISEAERLNMDFLLRQGLIKSRQEIDSARKSPMSADFGRLRSILRGEALGPASRLVVRTATALHEETVAWLAVQELIGSHLKSLADITGESLRAAQEE